MKTKEKRPITRKEFEEGIEFRYRSGNGDRFSFNNAEYGGYIRNESDKCYYGNVEEITDEGFEFYTILFGKKVEVFVKFKYCEV